MRYLSEFLWTHSWDVNTLVSNTSEFLNWNSNISVLPGLNLLHLNTIFSLVGHLLRPLVLLLLNGDWAYESGKGFEMRLHIWLNKSKLNIVTESRPNQGSSFQLCAVLECWSLRDHQYRSKISIQSNDGDALLKLESQCHPKL